MRSQRGHKFFGLHADVCVGVKALMYVDGFLHYARQSGLPHTGVESMSCPLEISSSQVQVYFLHPQAEVNNP